MAEAASITSAARTSDARWPLFVRRGLAVLVGAIFVYAGTIKLFDPVRFAADITNYEIVPWPVAIRLAFYLPWLEVLCGLALIFQRLFSGALLLTGALTLIFLGATISLKARGLDVNCGCFGTVVNLGFGGHLVLDLALLGILVVLWYCRAPRAGGAAD
jgi:hypothetical protein